jgi:glycosyltransferase involved in cell wall biosynthesis
VTIRQIVSCRGWSSDAYWAARATVELERAGHDVTLVCRRRSEARVIRRAREAGVTRIETLELASGVEPAGDVTDLRRLVAWLPETDVLHVHRGKEHWLAALANRLSYTRRPLVRTRHIVLPVRAHALNRWLYGRATDAVVTVTGAIRQQLVAGGLGPADRVVAIPGGVDADRFRPGAASTREGGLRARLGLLPDVPLIGLVSGFRVMKGHETAIAAAARLAAGGRRFHLLLVGQGPLAERVRGHLEAAGLRDRTSARVVFEYLASGVAVVASRVGVVPEVLEDRRTALLVPAGEPEPLAAVVGQLLDDPALRRDLGAAGARLVRASFSGARLAERLTALYLSRAVASSRPAP